MFDYPKSSVTALPRSESSLGLNLHNPRVRNGQRTKGTNSGAPIVKVSGRRPSTYLGISVSQRFDENVFGTNDFERKPILFGTTEKKRNSVTSRARLALRIWDVRIGAQVLAGR